MSNENIEQARSEMRAAIEAAESAEQTDAVVPVTQSGDKVDLAVQRKNEAIARRDELLRNQIVAQQQKAEMDAHIQKEMERLKQMQRDAELEMAPLLAKVARMTDGIHAFNIYFGRGEEIVPLLEGERATEDEVVYVRQSVLAMDEESVIAADADGMDFRDIDKFRDWLIADQSHVDQIIPEKKAVVALIPRRASKNYDDPWLAMKAGEENSRTYWLIRNGECLWMTTTDFTVGSRLVPGADEFTDIFRVRQSGGTYRQMEPGSHEWEKAEEKADLRNRHYMKVALLLEGLMDRTTILHPISTGASFLDQRSYDSGLIRIISDDDNALGTGRPSFDEWQKEKVSHLRVGMRVTGAFGSQMDIYDRRDYPADVRPEGSRPENFAIYILKGSTGKYTFTFDRTDKIFDPDTFELRAPKTKATGYIRGTEKWILPLDLVTEEEINYYLNSRSERKHYLTMIPTLRATLAMKKQEREQEAPFRQALVGVLSNEMSVDDAEGQADDLIFWYKTANKWQRLLSADDAGAIRTILAESRRRAKASGGDTDIMVEKLWGQYPNVIAVARRTNDFVVVERPERAYPGVAENVYVTLHTHGLRGVHKQTQTDVALRRASVGRWVMLRTTEAWKTQEFDADTESHPTDDVLTSFLSCVKERLGDVAQIRYNRRRYLIYVPNDQGTLDVRQHYFEGGSLSAGHVIRRDVTDPQTNYWGGPRYSQAIYEDTTLYETVNRTVAERDEEHKRNREFSDQVQKALRLIEGAWKSWWLDDQYAKFQEDFSDESLWENHKRTLHRPDYPGEDAYRFANRWSGTTHTFPLNDSVRAAIRNGRPTTGLSVRELVEREGFSVENVHAQIIDLYIVEPEQDGRNE